MNITDEIPQHCKCSGAGFVPNFNGSIALMLWNAKSPEEDGIMLHRHSYNYRYDTFNRLVRAYYAQSTPSESDESFQSNTKWFDADYTYDLGGNMVGLWRNYRNPDNTFGLLDNLSLSYNTNSYRLEKVEDAATVAYSSAFTQFVNVTGQQVEYTYDGIGRMLSDANRGISMTYNPIGLPKKVDHNATLSSSVEFTYDAAGNKLQKKLNLPSCAFAMPEPCRLPSYAGEIDYIGNFVYENGELKNDLPP